MSFKKKLFTAIGPFVIAVVILGGILFSPLKIGEINNRTIEKASTSMAINVIKGDKIKNAAMETGEYVPFFGSSELSRVNAFHPSVLAEKYDRDYRPFLLGAAGTQSLSQFLMLQSMSNEMYGKKAVFIISPQWFVKGGVKKEMFSMYFSPLQTYEWLINVNEINESTTYFSKRLLRFPNVQSDTTLKGLLKQVSEGELLTDSQKKSCEVKLRLLSREDELFGRFGIIGKDDRIAKDLKQLPVTYDNSELDKLAYKIGKKSTSDNEFEISNTFYKKIAPVKASLKNSQKHFDYRYSPEFGDFQLVLEEMARLKMDVMFVIPPVNEKWSNYTGLSTEMLDGFSKKINHQLKAQGFNNVVDFTDKRGENYFMEDTIHLGWRGWVALDKELAPFLENKESKLPEYHVSDYYFSKEWQRQNPDTIK